MKTQYTTYRITKLSVRREPQGAWRWQTPYTIRRYIAAQTRDGRWIWKLDAICTGKLTAKRIPAKWFGEPIEWMGGLHHKPIREINSLLPYNRD